MVGASALAALVAMGALLRPEPLTVVFYLSYAMVGAILVARRPRNPIGWVLLLIAYSFVGTTNPSNLDVAALQAGTAPLDQALGAWVVGWSGHVGYAGLFALAVLFPTGRFPNGRGRAAAAAGLGVYVATAAIAALAPELQLMVDPATNVTIPNPIVRGPALEPLSALPVEALILVPVGLCVVGIGSMVVRYRRSTGIARLQFRWLGAALTFAVLALAGGLATLAVFGPGIGEVVWIPAMVAYPAVPVAVGIAVMRYRLYEIDTIINRTVLYGGVTAVILAAFGLANIGLQRALVALTGERSELLTGALGIGVAVAYGPLRRRVRPVVDRFLPGRALVTLLFTDIVGSTERIVELGDERWRMLLGRYRSAVRQELSRYGGHEVDTAGDAFFATFERPSSGVGCAVTIRSAAEELGIQLRTGVHLGECEMRGEKVSGIEVHTAARIMAAAGDGEILLSAAVRDAISGTEFPTADIGSHELKGVPGAWQLYALDSRARVAQEGLPAASHP